LRCINKLAPSLESSVNAAHRDRYLARMRKLLDHIDAQLDASLDVSDLAAVAAFSPFHCQRQFSALFGLGLRDYVQRLRLLRAGRRLAFRADASVTDIAYDSGYEHAESFSRAFRRVLGQSPSAFRERPDWDAWLDLVEPLHRIRSQHMHTPPELADVRILTLPDTRIALLDHVGPQERLGDSIRRFIAWRRANRLPPSLSATYTLLYDDPDDTPPAEFRFGLAAATDREIEANAEGVVAGRIPGGRCAVLRHVGSEATLGPTIRFLFAEWLPSSGEALRDCPPFLQRVAFFPDVPEHQAVTDIFLPLES
jgi:AraC family transcriptional regulator